MSDQQISLSIVIPVYNEEELLRTQLHKLWDKLSHSNFDYEVIIVDDGSADSSRDIVISFNEKNNNPFKLVTHETNLGLGAALRSGFQSASKEYAVFIAIDLDFEKQVAADFLPKLGQADVLVGVRLKRNGYNPLMKFNSWLFIRICHLFLGLDFRDVNWTSVYKTELLKKIPIKYDGIVSLVEIIYRLKKCGATFLEIETVQPPRTTERKATASRFSVMIKTFFDLMKFIIKRD